MKITVVRCLCGLPQAHRKFEIEDGRRSKSFFSIEGGRKILSEIFASREVEGSTTEEVVAAAQELASCGLPATNDEVAAIVMGSPRSFSDDLLRIAASALVQTALAKDHPKIVADALVAGLFSVEDGAKILALAKEVTDKI